MVVGVGIVVCEDWVELVVVEVSWGDIGDVVLY